MKKIPIILAGGIGERFWPMSRSNAPKQLHAVASEKTMLEETLSRVRKCCDGDVVPMLITGEKIAGKVKTVVEAAPDVYGNVEIIAEPVGKNTAPAIALAAAIVAKRHGDAVMVVVSADHAISPAEKFASDVDTAANAAQTHDGLVVFGIKPVRPETGYGYIELGENVESSNVFKVKRFVEKPNAENARLFMSSQNFLWNSGMFVWKASAILREFETHMNALYEQAQLAAKENFSKEAIEKFYNDCESESIDFGIMEHAQNVSAVCANFFWDDLGSWESLGRVCGKNDVGTTQSGTLIYENDCADSLIVNKSGRTLAAVGLKNVAVISVDDATLVIERSRLPDLKKYLTQIKSSGKFPSGLF